MLEHTALQVAKWFLAHNKITSVDKGDEFISNLKLQKLLYYAQGCFLAITDKPLFQDEILAWKHGPVVADVYYKYSSNGSNGIVFDEDFDFSEFSDEENEILTEVYDVFGQYSAWKLRDMTHEETPWLETRQNSAISQDSIKAYFKEKYIVS